MRSLRPSLILTPLAATLLLLLATTVAQADIPVPDPVTVWAREDVPTINVIISAGLAISAVVIAIGLVLGRFTGVGAGLAAGISAAVLAIVWAVAGLAIWRAEADRGLWAQWEVDEASRQRNWRGPPRPFEEGLPPEAPPSASAEPASPAPPPEPASAPEQ